MKYNKQFADFLAKMESVANPSNKAKIHAIQEAYMVCTESDTETDVLVEGNEVLKGAEAKAPETHRTLDATRYGKSTPEQKAATTAKNQAQQAENAKAMQGFDDAKKNIMRNAVIQPGQVDAWVDARLKPAIKEIVSRGDGFLNPEEKKAQYKEDKKDFMEKFNKNTAEAKKELDDALKAADKFLADEKEYAREEKEYQAAQKARAERDELAEKGQSKSEELDASKTDPKFNAKYDPLNATKEDSAMRAGYQKAMEDMKKKDEPEAKAEEAKAEEAPAAEEKKFSRPGMPTGLTDDTKERIAAADKKPGVLSRMKQGVYNWADKNKQALDDEEAAIAKRNSGVANPDIYGENTLASKAGRAVKGGFFGGLKRLFQSVDAEGLRACFESVYGDSSEFSDDDIRTICESVYRRALTEGAVGNNALVESALLEGEALDKILATIKKLGLGSAVVAALAGTAVGGIHALDGQPNSSKQTIEFTSQTPNNMYGKYAAAATDDIKLSAENAKKLLTQVMHNHDKQKDSVFSKACDYMNDLLNSKSALNGTNADSLNHLAKVAFDGTNFAKAELAKDAK